MLNDRAEAKRRGTEKKLSMEVDWIGWRISLASWLVSIPDTKIRKIMSQVHSLMAQTKVPIKELQSLVRRLLWLTSAWHYLRPLLVPLYKAFQPSKQSSKRLCQSNNPRPLPTMICTTSQHSYPCFHAAHCVCRTCPAKSEFTKSNLLFLLQYPWCERQGQTRQSKITPPQL